MQNNTSVVKLDINLIIPNKYQPRKVFDDNALESLADSIKQYGIINPILVRKKDDKYEIIAGERRFRSAQKLGLTEVPVIIKDASEQQMAELALIENLQRQNLSPIEEAKSYEEIMRIGNQTQASLATKVGKSQSFIANKIRLLSLPEEIQDALANKKISERHARSLLNIPDKEKQIEILNRIIDEKLTVKETEQIINETQIDEDEIKKAISDIMKSLNIEETEEENKKEEKEDDNMNNGNFFPNYDNNNAMNTNASLNMMNMQSMNQPPMEPVPEVVMPTPSVDMQTQMVNPQMNPIPSFDQFSANPIPTPEVNVQNNLNPMDNFMNNMMPQNNPNTPMMEMPQVNDAPIFGTQFGTSTPQPALIQPEIPTMMPPIVDEPLFNPNAIMPQAQPVDVPTSFEMPVTNNEPVIAPPVDKLLELQDLLNANGYNYKVYSNDTEHCIIIELPKN